MLYCVMRWVLYIHENTRLTSSPLSALHHLSHLTPLMPHRGHAEREGAREVRSERAGSGSGGIGVRSGDEREAVRGER
jgi:hypothetical protein